MSDRPKPIDSSAYTQEYFLTDAEGHVEYTTTGGRVLPSRLRVALEEAGPLAGRRVLDLGCGRGEIVFQCLSQSARAVGADYATAALSLARRILPGDVPPLVRSDAKHLPFPDDTFDVVFMLDLVEHLLPDELAASYREVRRVLAPGGRLIIHTMPNLWYYRYGYPVFRAVQRLRGVRLPRDPRLRSQEKHVHVNEQTLLTMRRDLRAAGLDARVELRNVQDFSARESNPLVQRAMHFLAEVPPFAWVFCDDIIAVALKPVPGGQPAPAAQA